MILKKKLNILHSFPANETKFRYMIDLLFLDSEYNNIIVPSLADVDENVVEQADFIIVHYLKTTDILFVLKYKQKHKLILNTWGQDIYKLDKLYHTTILPKTKSYYLKLLRKKNKIFYIKELLKLNFSWLYKFSSRNRNRVSALKKFKYINPVVPGDYYILKNNYPIGAKLAFNKVILPFVFDKQIINGNNILVGNSAAVTNNHFEIIDILSKIKLEENRKIIFSLNYGNPIFGYAEKVEQYAIDRLGLNRTIFLKEFLPYEKYSEIISSCNCIIMNHTRQQAVGNVLMGILQGAKIFLRKESPVCDFLITNNIKLEYIDEKMDLNSLPLEHKINNINIIKRIYDPQKLYQDQYDFFRQNI